MRWDPNLLQNSHVRQSTSTIKQLCKAFIFQHFKLPLSSTINKKHVNHIGTLDILFQFKMQIQYENGKVVKKPSLQIKLSTHNCCQLN